MQNIKKYFMTLALLLTAATGAWADDQSESFTTATYGKLIYTGEHFTITGQSVDSDGLWIGNSAGSSDRTVTIESKNGENITKIEAVLGYVQEWGDSKLATTSGDVTGTYEVSQTITISSVNATTVTLSAPGGENNLIQFKSWTIYYGGAAASTVEVAWDKATKTGTFTQPAGNVIVEPEYFAVAEFTDGGAPTGIADIKATTDDDIVKAGTVKNIGSSTTPQGTVMYYAVQSATAPTAPDYDATGWTDKVPTATDFAEGNVYVWYYIKGAEPASGTDRTDDNTCSDSEITALGTTGYVTLLAAPKYHAEFAFDEGTPDAEKAKWGTNIPDGGVVKGQTVTVTYSGSKKVLGVKAEKKAAGKPATLAEATVGMLVGSDGKTYAAADKNNLPEGVTAVALVCYVSDGHGLALALADESSSKMTWNTAKSTCSGKTPAVTGCTWKLATKDEWNNMINAAGGFSALRDGFSSVGGTNMLSGSNDYYWSSTTTGSDCAWSCTFSTGNWTDDYVDNYTTDYVRACLAF
jgi:hypothetical protein